jgi:hypothetical protein
MATGGRLWRVLLQWACLTPITIIWCSGSSDHLAGTVPIAFVVLLAVYLVSFGMALRAGGQTGMTVCAAGAVGEIAFLGLYVAVASSIYWY